MDDKEQQRRGQVDSVRVDEGEPDGADLDHWKRAGDPKNEADVELAETRERRAESSQEKLGSGIPTIPNPD
jgi:hypothetical protein